MDTTSEAPIRVLVADDDALILKCYRRALAHAPAAGADLESLSEELFDSTAKSTPQPAFELVECSQGNEALAAAEAAMAEDEPFDVVVLDVRMPPGINGVEVGERIRRADPEVPIVFVSGYSDVSHQELARRVPPASRLHVYAKPLSFKSLARDIATIVRKM
ncbi:MAG: response regulator [Woeseiaceae bacterium]|nr:response regulator [Woeseiaceae bacterium]